MQEDGWHFFHLVYYAPKDPKVWVSKFHGHGITLNFARGESYLWLGALASFLGVTALRIRSSTK